ncbi:MAG: hypothetical protein KAQ78_03300, partial [Candidatus Latescibacteria bacterium]|nr:hypothetical protein [Candidatus Latescibacterota bacterium]
MEPLFEVKSIDRKFYEERLRDFLPEKFIDIHTHVWLDEFRGKKSGITNRFVTWPSRVAHDNPIEDLISTYPLMFPG